MKFSFLPVKERKTQMSVKGSSFSHNFSVHIKITFLLNILHKNMTAFTICLLYLFIGHMT